MCSTGCILDSGKRFGETVNVQMHIEPPAANGKEESLPLRSISLQYLSCSLHFELFFLSSLFLSLCFVANAGEANIKRVSCEALCFIFIRSKKGEEKSRNSEHLLHATILCRGFPMRARCHRLHSTVAHFPNRICIDEILLAEEVRWLNGMQIPRKTNRSSAFLPGLDRSGDCGNEVRASEL